MTIDDIRQALKSAREPHWVSNATDTTVTCQACQESFVVPATDDQIKAWQAGMPAQKAMPQLSPSERELFISGTCGACFNEMFAEDE